MAEIIFVLRNCMFLMALTLFYRTPHWNVLSCSLFCRGDVLVLIDPLDENSFRPINCEIFKTARISIFKKMNAFEHKKIEIEEEKVIE